MTPGSILAVATLKGGSGKSTLASCLAVHWRQAGRNPLLIDADPQRSLVRLAAREGGLAGVPVIEDSGETVIATARAQSRSHTPVIVDTAGFRASSTLAALEAADLVVVPVKASPLDVDVMVDTARTLFAARDGRRPRFFCVLTQTTRDSVIARHIRAELLAAGFPLFDNEMVNRIAYGEAALYGTTPTVAEPRGRAAQEIAALAAEIERALMQKGSEE